MGYGSEADSTVVVLEIFVLSPEEPGGDRDALWARRGKRFS